MLLPSREDCVHTSCFCEENVWKLMEYIQQHDPNRLQDYSAIFISNAAKTVPIWFQRAGFSPDQPVVWDYHVICLHCPSGCEPVIYDLDTLLPFPYPLMKYLQRAIQSDDKLRQKYHRMFRVIPAELFLKTFASNRTHMKKADGSWMQAPPTYPCISTEESSMNLDEFISMEKGVGVGQVMDLTAFTQQYNT
ncbi:protein N-terminal glutamine amidohydrolase-like isoform X2 [Asterias rubens]|uniref:protein N-terminal glutamine amidohydrolase-like isoform X2 n=1 Tax=Asterias rubens TaxID=7604 RepID=UPI001455798B|nr:protein N-terminal glutamine amidohydrolase-like isoform X2 [Asterias rubens]